MADDLSRELTSSHQAYIIRASDGQNSIVVRTKDDELDECYRLMHAAAARIEDLEARKGSAVNEMWDCPDCAFSFDAMHTDNVTGGYSCPLCRVADLERVLAIALHAVKITDNGDTRTFTCAAITTPITTPTGADK